jgi:hypothetical protein
MCVCMYVCMYLITYTWEQYENEIYIRIRSDGKNACLVKDVCHHSLTNKFQISQHVRPYKLV